jgi:hypothetical protein
MLNTAFELEDAHFAVYPVGFQVSTGKERERGERGSGSAREREAVRQRQINNDKVVMREAGDREGQEGQRGR